MKRYYLIKVQADFCPMLYVSAKNFLRLLDVCNEKGIYVTVYRSLLLHSNPEIVTHHFKDVFNIIPILIDFYR